ncbi:MAG: rhomboid family intramembrane serine protease [Bacteroidetes bacterium RIFOXYA12_FULL_35_11]|nr:MAG: rhomboid family intramembrane serine protease [Bacteroidetes bacterium GWF2_35_48]OFY79192.1 MAG: rhomboid family intramembrane serine protease [Bacteroidetes bacterium RIFOXYA12_FULL_35_11]HBX52230.1 rhomboid family intramembrane serine protease [Bacteroidales bacterium]
MINITIIIIAVTLVCSVAGFYRPEIMEKFRFNAYRIIHHREYYRLITHAFLHVDWMHLIVNMMVLYSFGQVVQIYFGYFIITDKIILYFLTLYFGSIIASVIYDTIKHKDNPYYNAVGASGAVSAIVYCSIFFAPMNKVYFFAIIPIPGIVFGILYLGFSWYMAKKGNDNIGHNAHFWGAVFGFLFPLIIDVKLLTRFLYQLF